MTTPSTWHAPPPADVLDAARRLAAGDFDQLPDDLDLVLAYVLEEAP